MINNIVLISIAVFFVILSGLFSGAEIGMYQLSRLRLRLGIEKKRLSFLILDRSLRDRGALLISMLVGTNLSFYLVTSIVTYMLLSRVGSAHTAEFLATLITTPVLFVFADLIPKNIFFYRADSLMPRIGAVLFVFHKLFTYSGVVPVLKSVTRIFAKFTGVSVPSRAVLTSAQRPHIAAILEDTHEEGLLSAVQSDIMKRLVIISNLRISAVMIPINNVAMVDINCDNAALLNVLKKYAFTRFPVWERQAANIVGFANIYEALGSAEQFTDLRSFVKHIRKVNANTAVIYVINMMRDENQKIILVTRVGREKEVGIVTMKDLVEELLGELAEW